MPNPRLLVRTAVAICLIVLTPHAEAGERLYCAKRTQVVQKLLDHFGETLRSVGLQQGDGVVEVYSSEATGTWTILKTRPDGISCLLAAGQLWEQVAPTAAGPGSDA
jgi:hypothetical protein